MRKGWMFALLATSLGACHGSQATVVDGHSDGHGAAGDSADPREHSTLTAETAPNTSASPLFADDYRNYNTSAQTGNGNGDLVLHGAISKLPLTTVMPHAQQILVETQTWFCHLAANEAGGRLTHDAKCGSHIDVGYNSDDPAQVARQVADLQSRGVAGVIMDWSGKDSSHDGDASFYPTAGGTDHVHARGSTEIATNAVYAMRAAAEASGFAFAVSEDEGITNCRKGWAGGCACWPAYGSACNETTEVISDLSYIQAHWATSPAYLRVDGKPVVTFFAPDYNACPDPNAADCQHIDWNAVHQFVGDQLWIFEHEGGYTHAFSGGAFAWPSPTLYPGADPTFALAGTQHFDDATIPAGEHAMAGATKGFDDAVTDGWSYGDGSHTRYIEQRCGLTWLDLLEQIDHDAPGGLALVQLVTLDDYEEATELETGIDSCITQVTGSLAGDQLAWTIDFGPDLTAGATGSERAIDHYTVWSSSDGEQLTRLADVSRDASGALPHALALTDLPSDAQMIYVQAVAKPWLVSAFSAPVPLAQ